MLKDFFSRYNEEMELEDAVHTAILTVRIHAFFFFFFFEEILIIFQLAQGRFRRTNDRKQFRNWYYW